MFTGLQQKWKVNGWRLFLIIATFAIGGSLCGYTGRRLMKLIPVNEPVVWTIVYVLLITLLWPLAVMLVSIPLGQYAFFKKYLQRLASKIGLYKFPQAAISEESRPSIAIFASGAGSNAAEIIKFSQLENAGFKVGLVVCNKPGAGVISIASQQNIPVLMIEKETFFRGGAYTEQLLSAGIDFIVLAGFLWKIPAQLVAAYPNRIINIHPALLPKYGGKGMYGEFVHRAVIANGESESGITIHWVDEHYDNGSIIFQAKCPVLPDDTPQTLAARIHTLEHEHFPRVVNQLMLDMF